MIADASVLLNLLATGAAQEILSGCGIEFKVCPSVANEVKMLRDRESGEEHPIDLSPLLEGGSLVWIEPETDEEFELLVEYTAELGRGSDGEAMCFALAESRGFGVATDDERAVKRANKRFNGFNTMGTIEILKLWQRLNRVAPGRMRLFTASITRLARYRPAPSHADYDWWENPDASFT